MSAGPTDSEVRHEQEIDRDRILFESVRVVYASPINEAGSTIRKIIGPYGGEVVKTETLSEFIGCTNGYSYPDLVIIDAVHLVNVKNSSIFDVVNLVRTLPKVNTTNDPTKFFVGLEPDADPEFIREIWNLDIDGIWPQSSAFSYREKKLALVDALSGVKHIPTYLADRMRNHRPARTKKDTITLTPRQSQILDLISTRGASNKVIAKTLKISESTVKLHMSAILKKFGCRNRTQLAVFNRDRANKTLANWIMTVGLVFGTVATAHSPDFVPEPTIAMPQSIAYVIEESDESGIKTVVTMAATYGDIDDPEDTDLI